MIERGSTSGESPEARYAPGAPRSAPGRLEIRKIRYFRDLLAEGYRSALEPGRDPLLLRSERVALGIDRPELDAVPYWSSRRDDGMVSIPFIEYVLGQIRDILDGMVLHAGPSVRREQVAGPRAALTRALREANRGGPGALAAPRLGDAFLPGAFVAGLCDRGALLDQVLACFDTHSTPRLARA
jgi:hypothetical protein